MEGLKQTALSVCALLVTFSALEMILPGEKYKKAVSVVLGAVFMVTLLSGITQLSLSELSFDVFSGRSGSLSEQSGSYARGVTEAAAEGLIGAALDENGILYDYISVGTNISGDGSISIERVTVTVKPGYAPAARKVLGSMFGDNVSADVKES